MVFRSGLICSKPKRQEISRLSF